MANTFELTKRSTIAEDCCLTVKKLKNKIINTGTRNIKYITKFIYSYVKIQKNLHCWRFSSYNLFNSNCTVTNAKNSGGILPAKSGTKIGINAAN